MNKIVNNAFTENLAISHQPCAALSVQGEIEDMCLLLGNITNIARERLGFSFAEDDEPRRREFVPPKMSDESWVVFPSADPRVEFACFFFSFFFVVEKRFKSRETFANFPRFCNLSGNMLPN